jgi:isopropylmalate/homocitrate/citramalate synthase
VPSNPVLLEEQSLRDALQNRARLLTLPEKLEMAGLLAVAGIRRLRIDSLVDPRPGRPIIISLF